MEKHHLSQFVFGVWEEKTRVYCKAWTNRENRSYPFSATLGVCLMKGIQLSLPALRDSGEVSKDGRQADKVCKGDWSGGQYYGSLAKNLAHLC